jgi:hypothetical protein
MKSSYVRIIFENISIVITPLSSMLYQLLIVQSQLH